MRHRVKTKSLHRDLDHRKSLMKNLSESLIIHEKIVTTITKAKYLRPHIEKLITRARLGNNFNNVKFLRTRIHSEEAIKKLVSDVAPRFSDRLGGYTRITKLPARSGDNAMMARIELVEKPTVKEETAAEEKTSILKKLPGKKRLQLQLKPKKQIPRLKLQKPNQQKKVRKSNEKNIYPKSQ